jgi:Protein of unknown function (DUF1501)
MTRIGSGALPDGLETTRRDFLKAGGLGLGSLGLGSPAGDRLASADPTPDRSVILLLLVGGPSQLETWDPKPDAPAEIRGPFGSIATRCPGVRISEHLPRLAVRMDRLSIIRSVYHETAPIHETGLQLVQTGRLCRLSAEQPHFGSVAAALSGAWGGLPPFVVVPGPIASTGIDISHGQSAGELGSAYEPFYLAADPAAPDYDHRSAFDRGRRFHDEARRHRPAIGPSTLTACQPASTGFARNPFDLTREPESVRDRYGRTTLGQSCLLARRLVEAGVRVVVVNMFDTVFNRVTWDCHGSSPFSSLSDYANVLLPVFDRAFSALVDDLEQRGRLETTLVVAAGEFGRTPRLNAAGGRDHWPGVWSVALAGGGVHGGCVVGASDRQAASPRERPIRPADLVATIYRSLRIDGESSRLSPDGMSFALEAIGTPIAELFT